MKHLSPENLKRSLDIKDLTKDPTHAISLLVTALQTALEAKYGVPATMERGTAVVKKTDNFDALGYPNDEVTLSERYTRYVDDENILRTQMTSVMPSVLKNFAKNPNSKTLWMCPGMVYRRDVVDRTHVGEPHQMDIWMLKEGQTSRADLIELIDTVVGTVGKILKTKLTYRANETSHHYTDGGLEVEINYQGRWMEILECGLAGKKLLTESGIDTEKYGGLALGMGLDRLVMIAKNIEDIRILRDPDTRVVQQMKNLNKYKVVSRQPMSKRDMSLAISEGVLLEELTEKIVNLLGEQSSIVEEISLVELTPYEKLPEIARTRLGMKAGQDNWLLRIILRHPSRTISPEEANGVYNKLYDQIHEGSVGYALK